jgi:DNA-binding MarR family transcriptional regulator
MTNKPHNTTFDELRQTHFGRLVGDALRRYDARVLQVMARQLDLPLSLANLAARGQLVAAHIHITRHLPRKGAKLVDLAINAGVSKQAMSSLVKQCENWDLVKKTQDNFDKRIFWIEFTSTGLAWLDAFEQAVQIAEKELENDLGIEVVTILKLGLEAYGASESFNKAATKRAAAS